MDYYKAIGDSKGTLLYRYFISDDPTVRAEALEEIRQGMGNIVRLSASLDLGYIIALNC